MILTWEIGRFCSSLWLLRSNLSYCIVLIAWCCLILLCIACVWFLTCICILPFGYTLSDPGLNLAMHAASCNSTNSSVNQDTRFNSVNYQVEGQDYHIRNWDYQETLCIALYLMMVMVLCGSLCIALCLIFDLHMYVVSGASLWHPRPLELTTWHKSGVGEQCSVWSGFCTGGRAMSLRV